MLEVGESKEADLPQEERRSRVGTPGFSLMDIKAVGAWSSELQYLIDEQ